MPKFVINLSSQLANGQQGLNFMIQLEAASFVDALEVAKPALATLLEESGLIVAPAAPAAAPAEPPAAG